MGNAQSAEQEAHERWQAEERAREEQRRREQAEHERWQAEEARRRAEEARQQAEHERWRMEEEQRRIENERREAEESRRRAEEELRRVEEERQRAEEERRRAEHAKWEAEEQRRRADEERQRAEAERWRAEEERRRSDEEKQRAQQEKERAEEVSRVAEAQRRQADEERRRAEEAQRRAEEERRRAEEDSKRAEEEKQRAEEAKEKARAAQEDAERASAAAERAAEEARLAQQEAEKDLKAGIRPVIWPTEEEIRIHKERLQYHEGRLHFAVAGIAGSGKSSLINALRGISNSHKDAARVGVTETTKVISRYQDSNPERLFVWYDVPGAGTLAIPDWQYFNDYGLYIFDAIIVLFDNRFTETDIALLRNAALFHIPTYIVRSKSTQHIANLMMDLDFGEGEDEGRCRATARQTYITETRDSVAYNLCEAELPGQRAYLITAKEILCEVVKSGMPKDIIDEVELLSDMLQEAHSHR
ncbi:interferon-inducible GTPase-domain-containing protein [Sparassis latifolia]